VPIPIPWTACGVPRGEAGTKFGDPHLTGVESTHNIYMYLFRKIAKHIEYKLSCLDILFKYIIPQNKYSQYVAIRFNVLQKKRAQLEYNILFATIDNQCKPSGAQCSTEFDFQS
jgi:hypothetical protein